MDINRDYWIQNPEIALMFSDIVDQKDSSMLMHCIRMYVDPRADTAVERNDEKRLEYIHRYNPDFNPDDLEWLISRYRVTIPLIEITYQDTKADVMDMLEKLRNLSNESAANLKFKMDAYAKVDMVLKKLLGMEKEVFANRGAVSQRTGKAGYRPSRLESGMIGK